MNYCNNCGEKLNKNDKFCASCGKSVSSEKSSLNIPKIDYREIAVFVILSLLTCGLYQLYWIMCITDDVNCLNDDNSSFSGIVVVLLGILTCGLYFIYWNYDIGRKLYNCGDKYNINIQDNSVVYLLLSLLKMDIVSCALLQSELNKIGK